MELRTDYRVYYRSAGMWALHAIKFNLEAARRVVADARKQPFQIVACTTYYDKVNPSLN